MNTQNRFLLATSFSLVLGSFAIAQDSLPDAVVTDQPIEGRAVVVDELQQKAVVDAIVREMENQGGSIVPPLEPSPNFRHERFDISGREQRPPRSEDRDTGQRRWEKREQLEKQFQQEMNQDPRRAQQLRERFERERRMREELRHRRMERESEKGPRPPKSHMLRDVSWHLQETAHRLEVEGLYDEADAIREAATMLRERSRALAEEEKQKPHNPENRHPDDGAKLFNPRADAPRLRGN
ncbi:MAG: hypothetical protein RIB44_02875 [Lacipirellulaceae bacterium]